jgi:expansin (peptidoglycan-binding protein)
MLSHILIFIGATCAVLVSSAPVTDNVSLEKRATFNGDGTYFYPGLGSCGHHNTDSDMIVALSYAQMKNGRNPNHNKNCGRHITVKGPKGSVRVKVVDTCPDPYCSSGSIGKLDYYDIIQL